MGRSEGCDLECKASTDTPTTPCQWGDLPRLDSLFLLQTRRNPQRSLGSVVRLELCQHQLLTRNLQHDRRYGHSARLEPVAIGTLVGQGTAASLSSTLRYLYGILIAPMPTTVHRRRNLNAAFDSVP